MMFYGALRWTAAESAHRKTSLSAVDSMSFRRCGIPGRISFRGSGGAVLKLGGNPLRARDIRHGLRNLLLLIASEQHQPAQRFRRTNRAHQSPECAAPGAFALPANRTPGFRPGDRPRGFDACARESVSTPDPALWQRSSSKITIGDDAGEFPGFLLDDYGNRTHVISRTSCSLQLARCHPADSTQDWVS